MFYSQDHKGSLDSKPEDGESFQMIPLLREDCWELKTGSVVIDNKLGHGAFGDVYQGIVRRSGGETKCEETDSPDLKNVAIKVLKGLCMHCIDSYFNLIIPCKFV